MAVAAIALDSSIASGLPWALLFAIVGEVVAFMFLARVLRRGGSIAVSWNWVLVVVLAPYLGIALFYLLPHRLQRRRLKRRTERLAWIEGGLESIRNDSNCVVSHGVQRILAGIDPDLVQDGNTVHLLASGRDTMRATCEAIQSAEHFVHLQTYILRPDTAGQEVLNVLAQAARRGVEVRLLYDSVGSWSLKSRHLAALRAAGGQAHPFLPVLWRRRPFTFNFRNHRKLLVVDGSYANLGGRNIGAEYSTDRTTENIAWLDLVAEVRGPAVTQLHRTFVEDWFHAVEEDLVQPSYFPRVEPTGDATVGVVATGPDAQPPLLTLILMQLITMAEETLDLSSPYLIPSPTVLAALELAGSKGVRVRIYTNGRPVENWLLYRAQRSHYPALLRAGVEIYESRQAYNHGKLILVDGEHVFLGSPNLDWRSAELNFELAIDSRSGEFCRATAAVFEERIRNTSRVDLQKVETGLLDGLCRLVSPLL